jgi:hypothetical protein
MDRLPWMDKPVDHVARRTDDDVRETQQRTMSHHQQSISHLDSLGLPGSGRRAAPDTMFLRSSVAEVQARHQV